MASNHSVIDMCLGEGDLSDEQVRRVLKYAERKSIRFCSAAYRLELLTEGRCLSLLEQVHECETFALTGATPDPRSAQWLSESTARDLRAIAVRMIDQRLIIVMENPGDLVSKAVIRAETGRQIDFRLGLSIQIDRWLDVIYRDTERVDLLGTLSESLDGSSSQIGTNTFSLNKATGSWRDRTTVVVLNSESRSLDTIQLALRHGRSAVEYFDDGQTLLNFVAERSVDAIIVGEIERGMNPLEVCRRLKSQPETKSLPLFLLSRSIREREWLQHPLAGQADVFFEIPFDASELSRAIQPYLGQINEWVDVSISDESINPSTNTTNLIARFAELRHEKEPLLESEPDTLTALIGQARIHESMGRYVEALDAITQAIEFEPSKFECRQMLAEFYERRGHVDRAMDAWQDAIMAECTPDQAALSRRAVSRLKRNHT